jgi:hypothetical protein
MPPGRVASQKEKTMSDGPSPTKHEIQQWMVLLENFNTISTLKEQNDASTTKINRIHSKVTVGEEFTMKAALKLQEIYQTSVESLELEARFDVSLVLNHQCPGKLY